MSAIAWTAIENALHAWLCAATGLAATSVIWADQGGPQPAAPYIALKITDTRAVGREWLVRDDAPDPVQGAELRVRARGHRTARLEMQCFGALKSARAAAILLEDALAALPLHTADIDAAGCGLGQSTPVQMLEGRRGSLLEPRAICELALHVGSEMEARTSYIERAQVCVAPLGGDPDPDLEVWVPDPPPPPPES